MARAIRLFVSCSPDLAPEREIVGQIVATLPVSVGWTVQYTPSAGEDRNAGISAVADCDIYLVLLGHDLAAPMGSEWDEALRHQHKPLSYRKKVLPSPAAQRHLRENKVEWQEFETTAELRRLLLQHLARTLLDQGEYFGLHVHEVEGLLELLKPEEEKDASHEEDHLRTGAGRGGIVLGRGNL